MTTGTTGVLAALTIVSGAIALSAVRQTPADLIVSGGPIYTADARRPRVDAIAVGGGRFVAAGTAAEVMALKGPATRVISLHGQAAVPGLHDAHGHFLGLGASLATLDLRDTASVARIVELVAAKAAAQAQWPMGRRPRVGSERLADATVAVTHGSRRGRARDARVPRAHRRPRRVGEQPGPGAGRHHRGDQGSRWRPADPRRRRPANRRPRRHGAAARRAPHPAADRRGNRSADSCRRPGDAAPWPDGGARRRRGNRDHRGLSPAERGRAAGYTSLRDDRHAAPGPRRTGSPAGR